MTLLSEAELTWSPVVANNRMNRERRAAGPNSYAKDLGCTPGEVLAQQIRSKGSAAWMDLCCGSGNALLQTAQQLAQQGTADKIILHGIDLVNAFDHDGVLVQCASVTGWQPQLQYDLITCCHGLHYVGDKLRVLQTALAVLAPGGLLLAHLDLANIVLENADAAVVLKRLFAQHGIAYNTRRRLLQRTGPVQLPLPVQYLGADDTTGPNYTGQPAVTSWYRWDG